MIAISSMIFSVISIIVTITSMITAKQILNSQGYGIVIFDVNLTASMYDKLSEYQHKTKKFSKLLSTALGLDEHLIEIEKPQKIPQGLKITIKIHLNHIKSRDIDYQKLLNNLHENGKISGLLKHVWDLNENLNISSFQFKMQESKDRQKGTIPIKVNSNSVYKSGQALPPQPKVFITNMGADMNGNLDDDSDSNVNKARDRNETNDKKDNNVDTVELYKMEGVKQEGNILEKERQNNNGKIEYETYEFDAYRQVSTPM